MSLWSNPAEYFTTPPLTGQLILVLLPVLLLFILFQESGSFRYHFKIVVYVFNVLTASLLVLPLAVFRPWNVRNVLWSVPIINPMFRFLGVNFKVQNEEILKKDFPCVVVCNHQSILDFLGMIKLWPTMEKCSSVAKKEILYIFPFGVSSWLSGTVFINRKNGTQSMNTLSKTSEQIRKEKTKLWIFPEGTRNKGRNLLKFKKGAFNIAIQNQLPIVPVVISPYTFVNDQKKIFNSGTVMMTVLDPIDTSGTTISDVDALTDTTYDLMNKEFYRLTQQVHCLAGENAVNTFKEDNKKI